MLFRSNYGDHRDLHSFPTRRSSDLAMKVSDQVGTVSEGKYADIIAVRGDVLRHIDLLQDVDIIFKHGFRYK